MLPLHNWDNIGREPLGSRRDIVIVVEEYFLKKGFTEHYISLNIVRWAIFAVEKILFNNNVS
jgi:hypothetical protein